MLVLGRNRTHALQRIRITVQRDNFAIFLSVLSVTIYFYLHYLLFTKIYRLFFSISTHYLWNQFSSLACLLRSCPCSNAAHCLLLQEAKLQWKNRYFWFSNNIWLVGNVKPLKKNYNLPITLYVD